MIGQRKVYVYPIEISLRLTSIPDAYQLQLKDCPQNCRQSFSLDIIHRHQLTELGNFLNILREEKSSEVDSLVNAGLRKIGF